MKASTHLERYHGKSIRLFYKSQSSVGMKTFLWVIFLSAMTSMYRQNRVHLAFWRRNLRKVLLNTRASFLISDYFTTTKLNMRG